MNAPRTAPPDDRRQTVLVVDDHDVVHWGFKLLFTRQPWVARCISARTGDEAIALTHRHQPDVALVDLFLAQESGADLCERLRGAAPGMAILLISGSGRISPGAARAAGAAGFVSKDWPSADVVDAVRMVSSGMTVFRTEPVTEVSTLSEREREVLDLIAQGATNPEIAAALHLSPHTVKEHTSTLYRKLGVRNRTEAVRRAHTIGMLA